MSGYALQRQAQFQRSNSLTKWLGDLERQHLLSEFARDLGRSDLQHALRYMPKLSCNRPLLWRYGKWQARRAPQKARAVLERFLQDSLLAGQDIGEAQENTVPEHRKGWRPLMGLMMPNATATWRPQHLVDRLKDDWMDLEDSTGPLIDAPNALGRRTDISLTLGQAIPIGGPDGQMVGALMSLAYALYPSLHKSGSRCYIEIPAYRLPLIQHLQQRLDSETQRYLGIIIAGDTPGLDDVLSTWGGGVMLIDPWWYQDADASQEARFQSNMAYSTPHTSILAMHPKHLQQALDVCAISDAWLARPYGFLEEIYKPLVGWHHKPRGRLWCPLGTYQDQKPYILQSLYRFQRALSCGAIPQR